jgi:hypothetical protein
MVFDPERSRSPRTCRRGQTFGANFSKNGDTLRLFVGKIEKILQKHLFIFQEMLYNIRQGKIAEIFDRRSAP